MMHKNCINAALRMSALITRKRERLLSLYASHKITCYRIQHRQTGFGPFTHADQAFLNLFKNDNRVIADIDHLIEPILKANTSAKFAFLTRAQCENFIRDKQGFDHAGFEIVELCVTPLFIGEGQVLYSPETISTNMSLRLTG